MSSETSAGKATHPDNGRKLKNGTGFVRMASAGNQYQAYYTNYKPMNGGDEFNFTQVPAGFIIMPPSASHSNDFSHPTPPHPIMFSDDEEENVSPYQSPQGTHRKTNGSFSTSSDRSFKNKQFVEGMQGGGEEYHYGGFGNKGFPPAPVGMVHMNNWGQPIPIPVPMPINMVPIPMGAAGLQLPPFISNHNERPSNLYKGNHRKRHQTNSQFGKNKGDFNRKNSYNNPNYIVDDSYANKQIADFKGQLYELAIQQQGSRFIQKHLGKDDLPMVLDEILPHIVELSQHSFGNYLVQKLIELGNISQKLDILSILKNSKSGIIGIASDPHGTRTLQRIVSELMEFDEGIAALVDTFKGNIIPLSENLNGNHVIQELLTSLSPKNIQFIFDEIYSSIEEVSVERHGCCVLQRCIDNGGPKQISKLCELILQHTLELSNDPFGNYVVQYILQMEKDRYFYMKKNGEKDLNSKVDEIFVFSKKILDDLAPYLKDLCFHKFGSNVIENLMKIPCGLSNGLFEQMIDLFETGGSEIVIKFLTDPFANYVLQTSLLSSQKQSNKNNYFTSFVNLLKPVIEIEIKSLEEFRKKGPSTPQKDHENHMKMLQLQRVLTICHSDYLKNRESTNYNSWGPNFNTKNHESFGFDKKKIKNTKDTNLQALDDPNFGHGGNLLYNYSTMNYTKSFDDIQGDYKKGDDQSSGDGSAFKKDYVGVVPLGNNN